MLPSTQDRYASPIAASIWFLCLLDYDRHDSQMVSLQKMIPNLDQNNTNIFDFSRFAEPLRDEIHEIVLPEEICRH